MRATFFISRVYAACTGRFMLKYRLLVRSGGYPRTHSLRRLIRELGERDRSILELLEDERSLLYVTKLEDAYVASRYLLRGYEGREVKDAYRFVTEVLKRAVERL